MIIFLLLLTSYLFPQVVTDSISSEYNKFDIQKLNSLKTDWNVINSPLFFYNSNSAIQNPSSLYTLYASSQINSGLNITQPDEMLNQFQLVNNWEVKKKYGVFAKYLGIAHLIGAVGIAAVSVANQNVVPKGKTKFKNSKGKK